MEIEPITDGEEAVIDTWRKLTRSLATKLSQRGVEPADITIALAYALHDAATELTGDPMGAVEWMRTAADTMERQLMGGVDATRTH